MLYRIALWGAIIAPLCVIILTKRNTSMAKVIEFRIPQNFQSPKPKSSGKKLLFFPTKGKLIAFPNPNQEKVNE